MGRVVKPIVAVEVILLLAAFAAGLTVIIPLVETEYELPTIKCLPYAKITYAHNPPGFWGSVHIESPDSNGPCDYCLFSQIVVAVVALASALYRPVTLWSDKYDLSFLRTLSVPLYALSMLGVLVEGIILQIGDNRFIGSVMEYDMKPKTCDLVQAELQALADDNFVELDLTLNFCSQLSMTTVASWVSVFCWLVLTILAGLQFFLQRHAKVPDDRSMLVYGAGDEHNA